MTHTCPQNDDNDTVSHGQIELTFVSEDAIQNKLSSQTYICQQFILLLARLEAT